MNARIDLAISAGLAEDPIAESRPDVDAASADRRPEGLLHQLAAMLAPLSTPRLQPCDCNGHAHR
ncbi:hypothetical protein E1202_00375 [Saccharopolyspora karakumensis]|uniref:Uncharacterized protein n=1 Tax=Saccharopolyspora karakumensis TaxID=2530386 RepID=A0A4R5C3H6_9PSEU|nr:hypothetical protein [Saccharopolyspora karakumensis]TDD93129.1 hypothetical protein E1202_00375 [Saccharopolyspora karakumensis]